MTCDIGQSECAGATIAATMLMSRSVLARDYKPQGTTIKDITVETGGAVQLFTTIYPRLLDFEAT
jgi:hypothetical protein